MRGGVTFDALGKSFELRFTTNAICRVEERSGKSLESLLADTSSDGKRTLAFRTLLWAGIGGITLETAGETGRLTMENIDNPQQVADHILALARRAPV